MTYTPGTGVDAVRAALAAMKAGTGDFAALRTTVESARFATKPTPRSMDDLAAAWDYQTYPDSFTDTLGAAVWQRIITREQMKELKGMAKFVGPDPTRVEQS